MGALFGHTIDPKSSVSLRDQVHSVLLTEIQNGRWSENEQLPTVRELAATSGLSTSPISQAMATLEQEGYIVRHVGRGTFLRSAKPTRDRNEGVVGIVYGGAKPGRKATASEAFDRDLMLQVVELLTERGYSAQVFHEERLDIEGWKPAPLSSSSPFGKLIGVINVGPVSDAVLAQAKILEIPLVCLGDPYPPPDVPFVAGGIQQAVWEALDILHLAGHRRIGLVHTASGLPKRTRKLRYEAFFGACAELDIHPLERWIVDVGPRYNVNVSLIRSLLIEPDAPTALVCTHNHAAQALYDVAVLSGVRIPEDLSVLLITSQTDFGDDFEPALSKLVIPMYPYAQRAVELLAELTETGTPQSNGGTLVRPVRRLRDSIGCPAGAESPEISSSTKLKSTVFSGEEGESEEESVYRM